jgi:hypothetical protein
VIDEVRKIYKHRRDVMVESFARSGWDIPVPKATMFAWAPIPAQYAHLGSLEFAKLLIKETGVGVAPGVGFGEYGDQYIPPGLRRKRTAHPPGGTEYQEAAWLENRGRERGSAGRVKLLFPSPLEGEGRSSACSGRRG